MRRRFVPSIDRFDRILPLVSAGARTSVVFALRGWGHVRIGSWTGWVFGRREARLLVPAESAGLEVIATGLGGRVRTGLPLAPTRALTPPIAPPVRRSRISRLLSSSHWEKVRALNAAPGGLDSAPARLAMPTLRRGLLRPGKTPADGE